METPNAKSQFSAADRAGSMRASRRALTGCVSKLSIVEPREHAYFDALKDYAFRYAAAQAYLADTQSQIAHDYTSIGDAPSEPDHGLLDDDGEPAMFAQISDDDIDNCGYMGWLRH